MATLVYYTATQLATIKTEVNVLLSSLVDAEIKKLKINAALDNPTRESNILLAMAEEIISEYVVVTSTTDGIDNNITESNFQTLVEKVYKAFPTLTYPR